MQRLILLLIIVLTSCSTRQPRIDYTQILDDAEERLNNAESLSEDTQLSEALEYYRTLEPTDSARLSQATILTAYHYWWKGESAKAYDLLEPVAGTDRKALYALYDMAAKDYEFEACYNYLSRIMEDEAERGFENQQALATLNYYIGRPEECERLFENLPQYIKTASDSSLYWGRVLPNYADIISDYGKHEKAIAIQEQILNHYSDKDSMRVAWAHASIARYYLLLDRIKEAEKHVRLSDEYADDDFRNNVSMSSYMKMLKSTLDYAKDKRINVMEWANFVNSLQENAYKKQAITDAKEANNQQLAEKNLKLTIEKQRTQIILTYVALALLLVIALSVFYYRRKKHQIIEKEEELEALRQLVSESQVNTEQKDDRFFKRIVLQQLGVIRMAASNPTTANQELLKRMKEITSQEVNVDALLNWKDLYQTMDYIYDGFYTSLVERFGNILNEKEIQLCCLLKANFSTKEISVVTQQSVRTVYQRKSTIRQTLEMPEGEDIISFIAKK